MQPVGGSQTDRLQELEKEAKMLNKRTNKDEKLLKM